MATNMRVRLFSAAHGFICLAVLLVMLILVKTSLLILAWCSAVVQIQVH